MWQYRPRLLAGSAVIRKHLKMQDQRSIYLQIMFMSPALLYEKLLDIFRKVGIELAGKFICNSSYPNLRFSDFAFVLLSPIRIWRCDDYFCALLN